MIVVSQNHFALIFYLSILILIGIADMILFRTYFEFWYLMDSESQQNGEQKV